MIDRNAFNGCTSLREVSFPGKLTKIGENAFENCSGLNKVVFSDSVTTLAEYAFNKCSDLKSIEGGRNISSIGYQAFYVDSGFDYDSDGDGKYDLKKTYINTESSGLNSYEWKKDNRIINISEDIVTLPTNPKVETKGEYTVSYNSLIPFFGMNKSFKSASDIEKAFGELTVTYSGTAYKASTIKVKIKGTTAYIQVTGTESTDKSINKGIKKATKGTNGLQITISKLYITPANASSFLDVKINNGKVKYVKVKTNGPKVYKAKKNKDYSFSGGVITFKGDYLDGTYTANS